MLAVDDIAGYGPCGLMRYLILHNSSICVALPSIDANISPANHAEALALLNEYADLFSNEPHNFELLKGASYRLDLEENRPFQSQLYQNSKD